MSHVELHRKAVILRKQKKSYSQIKSILGVSKSTLSDWLRAYPLTNEEINSLRSKNEVRIEKYRQTMKYKRESKLEEYRIKSIKDMLPLSKKELMIAGLFLYWGEGNKASRHMVSINNTDPRLVKFSLFWFQHILNIPKKKIKIFVHLYTDMNIKAELAYWSKELHMPLSNFSRPYIKESFRKNIDQKGYGHGTCGIIVNNTVIKDTILANIDVIAEYYVRKLV